MAQSRKGVSVSTDTPGSGSGDNSGYWQSLAFKTGRAESTCLWAGGGRKVAYLSLVFLRAFVDHLSQSCNSRALAGGKGPHRHF